MVEPVATGSTMAKLARPQNIVYSGGLAILTARMSGAGWVRSLLCFVLLASLYAVAAGVNNQQDRQVDIANHRHDNPFTSGRISRSVLYGFFAVHGAVIVASQLWLRQPWTSAFCVLYIGLLLAYSLPRISLQSKGFAATVCLAMCYGTIPLLLGGVQGGHLSQRFIVASGLQIFLLAPLLLAKDYKDLSGDQAYGKRTPLVRYGKSGVIKAAAVSLVLFVVFAVLTGHRVNSEQWVVVLTTVYSGFLFYIHHRNGRQPLLLTRINQLVLLAITWQLLR